MRNTFADELTHLARASSEIVMLSGDIGNRLFNTFKDAFGDRFLNCGVAEANMMSMASGLALSGYRPVCYTITPFATTRCLEQIRVDVCYHNQPVVIVGVGAGLCYASDGPTHHSCEDIALMRALPNMTVVCPADAAETRAGLRAALRHPGPVYLRLGKKNEPIVHKSIPEFVIGKSIPMRAGDDVCVLSTGIMLPTALAAATEIESAGVSVRVESFHTVKPLDVECLSEVFGRYRLIVTVEEHSRIGGFGSAVAEWAADTGHRRARLLRIGTSDRFFTVAGNHSDARAFYGLTADAIATQTMDCYLAERPTLVAIPLAGASR